MATFRIITFGCKVNQCDSQIIRETLAGWGLEQAGDGEPDLVIINTCTVTSTADSKFRKALRRIRRENPRSLTAVTGCFANRAVLFPEELPEADVIFKMRDFDALADFLRFHGMLGADVDPSASAQTYFAEHTRAFLKIQDGCDRSCSYCIVPAVRPELWSEEPDKVVSAINDLSRRGYNEVALTGIHLGFYGRSGRGNGKSALVDLMRRIESECDIRRVRLSSIEINEAPDVMLDLMANSEKFCKHLHLPLQSGEDVILRRMGRSYSSGFYCDRVDEIRSRIPDVGITTDIIVGFPGETDDHFDRTIELVERIGFAKIHVFRFSARPGTKAAEMRPRVPQGVVSSRARRLIRLGDEVATRFRKRFVGQVVDVLAEGGGDGHCVNGGFLAGFSSNYIKVRVPDAPPDSVNRILPVLLTGAGGDTGVATGTLV